MSYFELCPPGGGVPIACVYANYPGALIVIVYFLYFPLVHIHILLDIFQTKRVKVSELTIYIPTGLKTKLHGDCHF